MILELKILKQLDKASLEKKIRLQIANGDEVYHKEL